MSTSGSFNGSNGSDGEGYYFEWSLASQNQAANTSTISWRCGWRFVENGCRGLRLGQAIVNGTTVYNDTDSGDGVHVHVSGHDHRPKLQTASGTLTIAHNSDGTKTFSASGHMTGWEGQYSSGSGSWALTAIPRISNPPSTPVLSAITSTSVTVTFTDGTGGATIDSRQIGYGTDPSTPTTTVSSDGSDTITGLTPGTVYYFWARTHNVAGYSAWSSRAMTTTLRVPYAPSAPIYSNVQQTAVTVSFTLNGDGGSAITGYSISYGKTSSANTTVVSATALTKDITDLDPGAVYYFKVRANNAVGNGDWSAVSSVMLVAGAWVKVGTTQQRAVPWVKVSGTWKVAKPWVRVAGTWRESI